MMTYYALVDCNNFYASCEAAFQPQLWGKPIIVLSNNDGCVVSRSAKAKQLGIKMGVPFWKIAREVRLHQIQVFSSNYALYADMSHRVADLLSQHCAELEIYSIDECFLKINFHKNHPLSLEDYGTHLREMILRCTGIPVCVGIATTKTLAKLANHIAKKRTQTGVYTLTPNQNILASIPVGEVWGVGQAYVRRLKKYKVENVAQLAAMPDKLMRQEFGVVGLRLLKELQGQVCYELEPPPSKRKNIVVSRSFSKDIYSKDELKRALANYASRLGEKLRKWKQQTTMLSIFIKANPFRNKRKDGRKYFSTSFRLALATSNTNDLITWTAKAVDLLHEPQTNYKKAGIMALDLKPETTIQQVFFENISRHNKYKKLATTLDEINKKHGKETLRFAACGNVKQQQQSWSRKEQFRSPCYTTNPLEMLRVFAK